MLMCANDGAIHKMDVPVNLPEGIAVLLQTLQDVIPDARLTPTIEATRDGAHFAVAFGQVPPRRTRTQHPEHAIDHRAVVVWRATRRFRFRQQPLQAFPLFVGQVASAHASEYKA